MAQLTCYGSTKHYDNKIVLLNDYDSNHDGQIEESDLIRAMEDYADDKITETEKEIVRLCMELGEDGINKFCKEIVAPAPTDKRAPSCSNYGDVDGDGWVSKKDAELVAKHVTGEITLTPDQARRADVNGDGKVTTDDALLIEKYATGKCDVFSVCAKEPVVTPKLPAEEFTIEAPEIIPGIKPPRVPLLTPELAKMPLLPGWIIRDADGNVVAGREADTIEFQEIIPGVTPPRVPQLIPSLEKLPLLPGWTIRNPVGVVVAQGEPLPTVGGEAHTKQDVPVPESALEPEYIALLEDSNPVIIEKESDAKHSPRESLGIDEEEAEI